MELINVDKMQQMADAKMLNMAEVVIYPLLDQLEKRQIDQMSTMFKTGTTNLIHYIAYIAAIKDIRNELQRIQRVGNMEMDKQYNK